MQTIRAAGGLLLLAGVCVGVAFAQRPALSFRGYAIRDTYDACLARAARVLQTDGYTSAREPGGDTHYGAKGIHWALIICEPPGGSRFTFHVIVASGASDEAVARAERDRLAALMSQTNPAQGGGAGGPTGGPGGGPTVGPPNARNIQWNWSANSAGANVIDKIGGRFSFRCPPNGSTYAIYGTDIYEASGSSICTAGVHAGLLTTRDGGFITIEILAGQTGYRGSSRNGIASSSFGSMGFGSFRFIDNPTSTGSDITFLQSRVTGGQPISWSQDASSLRSQTGRRYIFACAPGGPVSSSVWGTDVYSDDSSICTAAVHAGRITLQGGGSVMIEIRPGALSYSGSTRNTITTANYSAWGGSFVFVNP